MSAEIRTSHSSRKRALTLLWFGSFFYNLYRSISPFILPLLIIEYGLTLSEAAGFSFSLFFTYAMCQIPSGFLCDRFDRRGLMIFSVISFSLATFLTGLLHVDFLQLLFLHGLIGLGCGFYFVPAKSVIYDIAPSSERGTAFGAFMTSQGGASIFSAVFTATLAVEFGWRSPYILYSIGGLLLVPMFYYLTTTKRAMSTSAGSVAPLKDPLVLKIAIISAIGQLLEAGFSVFIPTYLVREFGLSLVWAGLAYFVYPLFGIFGSSIGGVVCDRVGRKTLLVTAILLTGLLFPLLIFARSMYFLLLLLCLIPLFRSMTVTTFFAYTSDMIRSDSVGRIFGLVNAIAIGGLAVGPVVMGSVVDNFGFLSSFALTGVCFCLTAAAAAFYLPAHAKETVSQ